MCDTEIETHFQSATDDAVQLLKIFEYNPSDLKMALQLTLHVMLPDVLVAIFFHVEQSRDKHIFIREFISELVSKIFIRVSNYFILQSVRNIYYTLWQIKIHLNLSPSVAQTAYLIASFHVKQFRSGLTFYNSSLYYLLMFFTTGIRNTLAL